MFEAIVGQVKLIHDLGGEAFVFATRDEFSEQDQKRLTPAKVHYADSVGPEALAYAPGLLAAMEEARLDCLHLHGIWQGSSLTAARWSKRHPGRTIISPHGMLDPWITERSELKKTLFRWGIEEANWNAATLFHALTDDEADDIWRWVTKAKVEVVPNPAPPVAEVRSVMPPPEMLYLGRIHPKKNIDGLIEGWSLALPRLPDGARLTIAGSGEASDVSGCQEKVEEAGHSVRYIGPVYATQKAQQLASSRFLALPSFSEGLPMAILDAWAAGTPTIHNAACHLPQGHDAGAAIKCSTDPEDIAEALVAALDKDEAQWLDMSIEAQKLASGPFGAETIATRWAEVYTGVMTDASHG